MLRKSCQSKRKKPKPNKNLTTNHTDF